MTVIAVDGSKKAFADKSFMAEQIWLQYFNRVLFEDGLITEREQIRMKNRIGARKPSSAEKKKDARRRAAAQ